jgi:hypothetical protein
MPGTWRSWRAWRPPGCAAWGCCATDTDEAPEFLGGTIVGAGSTAAVTALAMGLPRPVDAAGRPAGLQILVGDFESEEYEGDGLEFALQMEGRGWVRVGWPLYSDSDWDTDDDASND